MKVIARNLSLAITALAAFGIASVAAGQDKSAYNPHETFAPMPFTGPINSYRSGSGQPGPAYWQNRADYDIHAAIDPVAKTLTASEVITYTNNSPDTLDCLWVQLDQNIYKDGSRASYVGGFPHSKSTKGYELDSVQVGDVAVTPVVTDTRMRVALPVPLPHGGVVKLKIAYHYTITGVEGGRTSWVATKNGDIFDMAQWFPRMHVYDDIRGWDTAPYLGNEFYLEYGDIDYSVTVPSDMLVAGGGVLLNPGEVFTAEQRRRFEDAKASDKTVMIRGPAEVTDPSSRPKQGGTLTWHYLMKNTRDVAFSASKAFVWDAARINLPGGKTALAESAYPVEAATQDSWLRSTEYLKDSVEHFSQRWHTYPYPTAWSIGGGTDGMEYPGMAFDGFTDSGKRLFWITAHEIGHTWFPMMVGSDERRDAWMDEGFNTFIDTYESDDFEGGVYGPKRDSEYAGGGGNPADEIQSVIGDPDAPPIMTRADAIGFKYGHSVSYFKTAFGLRMLREQILGHERFDAAFRKYIDDWAFKHPKPSDFFREMESESGEDLAWFWRGWFFNNWNLDMAVQGVAYVDGDPAKGAKITLANLDRMAMPAVLEVDYADGTKTRQSLPAETWIQHATATITVAGHGSITQVILDPDHLTPDRNRANNIFTVPAATPPAPAAKP